MGRIKKLHILAVASYLFQIISIGSLALAFIVGERDYSTVSFLAALAAIVLAVIFVLIKRNKEALCSLLSSVALLGIQAVFNFEVIAGFLFLLAYLQATGSFILF